MLLSGSPFTLSQGYSNEVVSDGDVVEDSFWIVDFDRNCVLLFQNLHLEALGIRALKTLALIEVCVQIRINLAELLEE